MSERRVAVVTGASGGLGRAVVRRLATEGYDIGLLARGRAGLEAAAEDVRAEGRRAVVVPTDVAVWEEVDDAAARITEELGPIDVWVNNAMTTVFASVDMPISRSRPDSLFEPGDEEIDRGARGIFDDETGGMLNRRFLMSIPVAVRDASVAAFMRFREVIGRRR